MPKDSFTTSLMEGADNGNGQFRDTAPNKNGVAEFPDNTSIPPDNGDERSPESAPEDNGQSGITFEELARKKGFSSPDDLARSYTELERMRSRNNNSPKGSGDNPLPERRDAPPRDVKTEERVARIEQRLELQDLEEAYPDARQYAQQILEKVRQNPGLPLVDAYKSVKFDVLSTEEREAGRQEEARAHEVKTRVSATLVPGARYEPPKENMRDKIHSARSKQDLQDIERMLPHV